MVVFVDNKRVQLDAKRSIGKGGEADVYSINDDTALKVWKTPDHPDFASQPSERRAAKTRLKLYQKKLTAFPSDLPPNIIIPQNVAMDRTGTKTLGYTMRRVKDADPLLRYSERRFRDRGISNERVVRIFRDLHKTVQGLHDRGVVIGDFNDLNVLVRDESAFVIDTDSFQFGKFPCTVFTARFVDPLLCDGRRSFPVLCRAHNAESDWYAFDIMLMQSLLFVGPYGGTYRPGDPGRRVAHEARPLHRISVFDPEVRYPKPAIRYDVLDDDLLQHFHKTFKHDLRGAFPRRLIDSLRWTRCTTCGTEHARPICPMCASAAPAAIKEVSTIRGKVKATRRFSTCGLVVAAALHGGQLHWVFHEDRQFKRENGKRILSGELDTAIRFGLLADETLVGRRDQMARAGSGRWLGQQTIDCCVGGPCFATNSNHSYWVDAGRLLRDGQLGSVFIGNVLANQTRFWIGEQFGFGFYRAGELNVSFVFDAERTGINDAVELPRTHGQLVDATTAFDGARCWFFTSAKHAGGTTNRCVVLRRDGTIEATAEQSADEEGWLSNIHGKLPMGDSIFSAMDQGIVRLQIQAGTIATIKEFPDTERFVDANSQLFPADDGIFVVGQRKIYHLSLR